MKLIPIKYIIDEMPGLYGNEFGEENVTLEITRHNCKQGCELWAIRWRNNALSKLKCVFIYESKPSDRDEDYYNEYRFKSVDDACEFWKENGQEIKENRQDYVDRVKSKWGEI